jgi:hypothetical protein
MSTPRRVTILTAAVLALSATLPTPVFASCNPGRQSQVFAGFAGTQRTPGGVPRAVETQIEEYSPFISGTSEVSAWNMLNNGGSKWSQVGWLKDNDGSRWTFIQWTDNTGHWFTNFYSPSALGSTPNYQTIYNVETTDWIWEKNSQVLHTANALWAPATIQIYGETHNRADQMPGGFNNHNTFKEAHYTFGAGWLNMASAAGVNDGAIYGAVKVNNEWYEIWDKACGS